MSFWCNQIVRDLRSKQGLPFAMVASSLMSVPAIKQVTLSFLII